MAGVWQDLHVITCGKDKMKEKQTATFDKHTICLLTDHHLCINPRLWKEAFFYEREGYEVVVLSMWQSADLLQKDRELLKGHCIRYEAYLNMIPGEINEVARFFYRLRKRTAGELQRWFKIGTGWAISHAPERMLQKAKKENAALYAAHLECGFFTGRALIKAGKKVSFDFEDWYSRDYLTPDRAVGLLSKLENFALLNGTFCTAASQSMADALKKAYPSAKKITTLYNSFPDQELDGFDFSTLQEKHPALRMIWTSRTVGPERGLETLLEALTHVQHPVELHIIGKCTEGYEDFLNVALPSAKGHRIIFHDFIPHAELLKRIATFDLGLAIERYEPDSRNTTITNKMLQYVQAGISVLATDTEGQKEVAGYFPDSVFLVPANEPIQWAKQIEKAAKEGAPVNRMKQQAIYRKVFSWPVQEQKLKQLISAHL